MKLFLSALLLTISIYSFSQCPPGDVICSTQAELDMFLTTYPNCTNLQGGLRLSSIQVTDASGLDRIRSLSGDLDVRQTGCSSIDLPNLVSVGGQIHFFQNVLLESINLVNLVGGVTNIRMHQNVLLEDVQMCSLIATSGHVYLFQNISLLDLCLDNLTTVGSYFILQEGDLSSVSTLNDLVSINGELRLSDTNFPPSNFQSLISINGDLSFSRTGGSIVNLAQLRSINGMLFLYETTSKTIDFPSLVTVSGAVRVSGNSLLEAIDISGLTGVTEYVYFYDNAELADVQLCLLTSTSREVAFLQQPNLTSLCLDQLTSIGLDLFIQNTGLSDLNTFNNLRAINNSLNVSQNPSLTDCSGLCPVLLNNGVSGFILFSNNPSNCSSQSEVETNCQPLVVEILDFNAREMDGSVLLSWMTHQEYNNDGFEIQRKAGEQVWESIGFLQSEGLEERLTEYDFRDDSPTEHISYYRLKVIDLDGQVEYTDAVSVEIESISEVKIFPNPSNHGINIKVSDVESTSISLEVIDNAGRSIWQHCEPLLTSTYQKYVDFENPGVYVLKIQIGHETITRRVVIME